MMPMGAGVPLPEERVRKDGQPLGIAESVVLKRCSGAVVVDKLTRRSHRLRVRNRSGEPFDDKCTAKTRQSTTSGFPIA